ncbi:unnamed protein product [Owenia fusiformis]|uniref:G-protein coupled receptors family 1 profile domain-containing protein n=1 Tax=Owenia fusiformis TaxID=6347 RepID=A0A8S4N4A0_OWEFU|nr:unnamed protein product [Owenia fusiformis]
MILKILIFILSVSVAFYKDAVMGDSEAIVFPNNTRSTENPISSTAPQKEPNSTESGGKVNDSSIKKEVASSLQATTSPDSEVSTQPQSAGIIESVGTPSLKEPETSGTTTSGVEGNDSTTAKEATSSSQATTSPGLEVSTQAQNAENTGGIFHGINETQAKHSTVNATEVTPAVPNEPIHLKMNVPWVEFNKTLKIASFYKIDTSFVRWESSKNKTAVTVLMVDYYKLLENIFVKHKKAVEENLDTFPTISSWNDTLTKIMSIDVNMFNFFLFKVGPDVIVPWEQLKKDVVILLKDDLNKILDKMKQVGVKDNFEPAYCKMPFDKFSRLWGHVTKFLIAIKVYAYCVICGLGIIGNILSYAVLSKDKINTSIFTLKVLAVIDTVHLILRMVTEPYFVAYSYTNWVNKTLDRNTSHEYAIATIYMRPLVEMAQMASAWTVVFLTLDRFIAICFPFKAINFCTMKIARLGVGSVVCFSVLYNIPVFFSMTPIWSEHKCLHIWMVFRYLSAFGKNWYYRIVYEFILNLVFRTFGPVFLVFIMNVKLVHELIASRKRREKITSHTSTDNENKDRNITVTLISISFMFLICIIPMVGQKIFDIVVYLVLDVKVNEGMAVELILSEYSHIYEASGIYGAVVDLLLIVNSSINIIVYCWVRKEFARILMYLFCPCRAKKESGIVSNTASSKLGSRSYSDSPM